MNLSDVNHDGIGMDGMDPVAYFNGEFLKGTSEFSYTFEDVTYWFANESNMELFDEDPAKYIPMAGSFAKGQLEGNLNEAIPDKIYVGNQFLGATRGLEDEEFDMEKRRPHEDFEEDAYDDEVEQDNLSDAYDNDTEWGNTSDNDE